MTAAGTWTVDGPLRAGFAARNFGLNLVRGRIAVTAGTLEIDPDGRPARLSGTLDPATIDTANPRRDRDLRGRRFLDVANHPRMELTADRVEPTTGGFRVHARLRVAGREAPLCLDGTIEHHPSDDRLTATATARLDLRDVGIRAPRILVGRHVELTLTARLTREGSSPPRLGQVAGS